MNCYLLVDFGSTYTKLCVVNIDTEQIVLTSSAITTIEDDIMIGFNEAYDKIKDELEKLNVTFVGKLGCSSAAGGLKMVAIGLVPELTSEAARRAALGAGAKILATYSYELSQQEALEINDLKPEIILLSGGTDGGNKEVIIKNAKVLASIKPTVPIIVACNKSAQDEIASIFDEAKLEYYLTENVMPQINVLNVEPVRDIIRDVFMKNIVHAKGLDNAVKFIGDILMPTPAAVLNAANILSKGTDLEDGLDELVIVDIGGATTDVHSMCEGYPSKGGVSMKGLEEPYAKRTVEGDLGMRYSASASYLAAGYRCFKKYLDDSITKEKLEAYIQERHDNIRMIPNTKDQIMVDKAIAKVCCELALNRHAGYIDVSYSPFGTMYAQYGKDLTYTRYLIGTGGVLVHNDNASEILKAACFDEENSLLLKPIKPQFLLDKSYILSAMGLLATKHPEVAIRIMKKHLIKC